MIGLAVSGHWLAPPCAKRKRLRDAHRAGRNGKSSFSKEGWQGASVGHVFPKALIFLERSYAVNTVCLVLRFGDGVFGAAELKALVVERLNSLRWVPEW